MKPETAKEMRRGQYVTFNDDATWSGRYQLKAHPHIEKRGNRDSVLFMIDYEGRYLEFHADYFKEPEEEEL